MYIYTPQTYFQKIMDHHHMNIVIFKNLKIPPLCFFLHCLYKIITKKLGVYNQELSASLFKRLLKTIKDCLLLLFIIYYYYY